MGGSTTTERPRLRKHVESQLQSKIESEHTLQLYFTGNGTLVHEYDNGGVVHRTYIDVEEILENPETSKLELGLTSIQGITAHPDSTVSLSEIR